MKKLFTILILLACFCSYSATITFTMTNQVTGQPDTNVIKIFGVNPHINADGSFSTIGFPLKIQPSTNGFYGWTNMPAGLWLATNQFIVSQFAQPGSVGSSQGVLFLVDNSTNTYPFTRYPASAGGNGYNVFNWILGVKGIIGTNGFNVINNSDGTVTLDGASFIVTINSSAISNALGGLPILGNVATNSFYPTSNPSLFVSSTITNGLATTNYVGSSTNLLTATAYTPKGYLQPANGNLTNLSGISSTNVLAFTNSPFFDIAGAAAAIGINSTNNDMVLSNSVYRAATNALSSQSALSATNPLTATAYKPITYLQPADATLTNLSGVPTNRLAFTNSPFFDVAGAAAAVLTNGFVATNTIGSALAFAGSGSSGGYFTTPVIGSSGSFVQAAVGNSFVLGGQSNGVQANYSGIIGGSGNNIRASIVTANNDGILFSVGSRIGYPAGSLNIRSSVILGGTSNQVDNSDVVNGITTNSVAAGYFAQALNSGTFVWSDGSSGIPFSSTAINEFLIRSSGGVGINTNNPGTNALRVLGNIDATGFSISGVPVSATAGSVAAGAGVTVSTNGTVYTINANPQTNLVVFHSGNATNITAQQSFSLGGGPTFSMSTNIIGISNSIARGTYQLVSPGVWTNLIQSLWSMNVSGGNIFIESNSVAVFELNGTTFNTTNWSIVAAPGAAPTPVSYIGSIVQGEGMVVTGYFPPSTNLFYIITNQAAIAATNSTIQATNKLGTSAFVSTNLFVRTTGGNSITNNAGNFVLTNPASLSMLKADTNGTWFMGAQDSSLFDSSYIRLSTNGSLTLQGGSALFNGSESIITLTDDLLGGGTGFIDMQVDDDTGHLRFMGFGALQVMGQGGGAIILGQPDYTTNTVGVKDLQIFADSQSMPEPGTRRGRNLRIYAEPMGSVILESSLVMTVTNGIYGNGVGITNVYWATTNVGLLATNIAYQTATNQGGLLTNAISAASNSIVSIIAGTTNLTKFNVNTNLLIAGISEEQINPAIITLRATNGVPWSLVYYRFLTYWTNNGSGYGVITNGSGLTPQWNLKDIAGNTLSFKTASPNPGGQWTQNFISTNAPVGDWGRVSDFGSGGNAEAWAITNLSFSALFGGYENSSSIIYTNDKDFNFTTKSVRISDDDTLDGEAYLFIPGGGNGISLFDGDSDSHVIVGSNGSSVVEIFAAAAKVKASVDSDGNPFITLTANNTTNTGNFYSLGTIYAATNIAGISTTSNPTNQFTTGVIYTGPPNRGTLVGSFVLNSGVSGSANITLKYTNNNIGYAVQAQAGSGVSTTDMIPFSVPLGTNATFQFVSTMGTGASGSITNAVIWNND